PETNATLTGGAKFDRNRKFGIEIEAYGCEPNILAHALNAAGISAAVESYNHATRRHWKITTDGSIRPGREGHPFELVSPVLKGEAGLEGIKKVCAVLKAQNVKVNKSTGLHVHHDAADLGVEDVKGVVTMWWKFEDVLLYFLPPSRRNNMYCRPAMFRGD